MNLNKVCQVLLVFFTLWTLKLPGGDAILPVIDLFSFKKHFLGWDGGGGWGWGGYYHGPEKLVTKLIFLKLLAIKQTLLLAAPPLALGAMAVAIGAKIIAIQLSPFILLHFALQPFKEKIHKHHMKLNSALLQPLKIFGGGRTPGHGHPLGHGHGHGHAHRPHVFYGPENFAPPAGKSYWHHWLVRIGRISPFSARYANVPRGWLSPGKNKVSGHGHGHGHHHVVHHHPPPPIHDEGGWTYGPGPPPQEISDYSIFEGPPPHYSPGPHSGGIDDHGHGSGGWTFHKNREEDGPDGWSYEPSNSDYGGGVGGGKGSPQKHFADEIKAFKGSPPFKDSGQRKQKRKQNRQPYHEYGSIGYDIGGSSHYDGGDESKLTKGQKVLPPPPPPLPGLTMAMAPLPLKPMVVGPPGHRSRFKRQTQASNMLTNSYAESEQFLENQLSRISNPIQAESLKVILKEASTDAQLKPSEILEPKESSFDLTFNRRSSNEESTEKTSSSTQVNMRTRTRSRTTLSPKSRAEIQAKITEMTQDIELFFTLVSAFDQNTCLEKLVCEIHSKGNASTFSEQEINIVGIFRLLKYLSPDEATYPMTARFRNAAAIGEKSQTVEGQSETCSKFYTFCDHKFEEIIEMGNNLEKISNAQNLPS